MAYRVSGGRGSGSSQGGITRITEETGGEGQTGGPQSPNLNKLSCLGVLFHCPGFKCVTKGIGAYIRNVTQIRLVSLYHMSRRDFPQRGFGESPIDWNRSTMVD